MIVKRSRVAVSLVSILLGAAACGIAGRERRLGRATSMAPRQVTAAIPVPTATPIPIPTPAPSPARPRERMTLEDAQGRPIEVYPPVTTAERAPLNVFLHATCMTPASVCDGFGAAARDDGWLVCPAGNATCYGAPDWSGTGPTKAAHLERALGEVEAAVAPFLDARPGVLIGWSRGAFAARDILYTATSDKAHAGLATRFRGLVLLAAHVTPDASRLRAAGITRVVMAAGDYDGARPTMTAAVATLARAGIAARYVSLGKIGHVWPEDFDGRMGAAITWAAGGE
jgi:predicted esterase